MVKWLFPLPVELSRQDHHVIHSDCERQKRNNLPARNAVVQASSREAHRKRGGKNKANTIHGRSASNEAFMPPYKTSASEVSWLI